MDLSQNNIGYFPQAPVCDKHLTVEINSDFSLPDYQPEIRRLLSTRATILPPAEYIGNGNAELEGEVNYKILYLGADGALYSTTLSDKYSFNTPFEFTSHSVNTNDITLIPSCRSENVSTRVLGPRKLNVRARITCHTLALSPALYSPNLVGAHNNASIENLVLETTGINIKKCVSEPQLLTELITLDSQIDNIRIVDSVTSVAINECTASNDKINIKGEALFKILYCNDLESDQPLTLIRKITFSSALYCDGVNASYECSASGIATDEQFNIEENGINVELSIVLSARAQKNEAVPYIKDSYSTERAVESKISALPVISAVKCSNGNLTQNEIFSLEDVKLSPDAKIIDVFSRASVNEVSQENGKLIFKGSSDHHILCYFDGEYSLKEAHSPLRYELDSRSPVTEASNLKWNAEATVVSARARSDGERLFVDCELNFCTFIQNESNVEFLSEMTFGEKLSKPAGELLLSYPDKDATLWSVAKQYGEPIRKIKLQNSIPDGEDIIKKKFLVI